jgi:hypothetical protein
MYQSGVINESNINNGGININNINVNNQWRNGVMAIK